VGEHGLDFGNTDVASISGTKYNDNNGDGYLAALGEPGIPGWVVYLDMNDNGVLDPCCDISTITDANGDYTFPNLQPGTYIVREVLKDGWIQTATGVAVPPPLPPPPVDELGLAADLSTPIIVTVGASIDAVDNDFLNVEECTISGVQ